MRPWSCDQNTLQGSWHLILELLAHNLSWWPGPRTVWSQSSQQAWPSTAWPQVISRAGEWCNAWSQLKTGHPSRAPQESSPVLPLVLSLWNVRSFAPAESCLSQGLAHIPLWGGRMSICPLVRETRGQASCPGVWEPAGMQLVWDHENSPCEFQPGDGHCMRDPRMLQVPLEPGGAAKGCSC